MFSPMDDFLDNFIFTIAPIFMVVISVLVFGGIISAIVSSVKENHKNNNSPRLTVPAKVVAKRTNVRSHGGEHPSSSTTYYVTFEVESGDRMEFRVEGSAYGMLVEQDQGMVSFQGTRYLGFERK